MQDYFLPTELPLTCPTCEDSAVYQEGSNATFGPGIFVKAMLLVVALCAQRHQFSVSIESVMGQISTS
jgi:hypothetical protein